MVGCYWIDRGPRRTLGIQLNRFDDRFDIVRDGDRTICVRGARNTTTAEDLLKLILVGRMVSDRGRGVFELMAGQNAHDAVFIADDTLLPQ